MQLLATARKPYREIGSVPQGAGSRVIHLAWWDAGDPSSPRMVERGCRLALASGPWLSVLDVGMSWLCRSIEMDLSGDRRDNDVRRSVGQGRRGGNKRWRGL